MIDLPKIEISKGKNHHSEPLQEVENEPFPLDIFPAPIQSYIKDCNSTLDSNIDYMACSLLWGLSTIIGNSCAIKVKSGWIEYCTIWVAIVGRAGVGKTPSMSMATRPFKKINSDMVLSYPKKHKAWKEAPGDTDEPTPEQLIVNDTTIEALVSLHSKNKNAIGMYRDELDGWVKNMSRYSNGSDLPFWLSAWSGEGSSSNRKSGDSYLPKPFIPIIGGIQPAILDTFNTEENKSNGFLDRILLCYPEISIEMYNENEMDQTAIDWYDDFVYKFNRILKSNISFDENEDIIPNIFSLDSDAKTEWKNIYNEISEMQNSDDENEYMKTMLPKQKSYIPRFILILHLTHNFESSFIPVSIQRDIVLKAWKLSKYFINQAKKVKVSSAETTNLKNLVVKSKDASNFEKFQLIFESNKKINYSKTADMLGVSRSMLYRWRDSLKV